MKGEEKWEELMYEELSEGEKGEEEERGEEKGRGKKEENLQY